MAEHHQIQKLKRQGLQPLSFFKNIIGRIHPFLFRHLPAPEHVGVADHGGQGRLQLMGEAADEVLLPSGRILKLRKLLLQVVGHLIEIPGQLAYLVIGLHFGPDLHIAVGDAAGGPGETAQGLQKPYGHQIAHWKL